MNVPIDEVEVMVALLRVLPSARPAAAVDLSLSEVMALEDELEDLARELRRRPGLTVADVAAELRARGLTLVADDLPSGVGFDIGGSWATVYVAHGDGVEEFEL